MATSPEAVRHGLQLITSEAAQDIRSLAAQTNDPEQVERVLFEAAPLVVATYVDGSAALGVDWYEELRELAAAVGQVTKPFTPSPVALVREDAISDGVGWATQDLREWQQSDNVIRVDFEQVKAETADKVAATIQKEIAAGLRDTITENVFADADATGWRRWARPGACKFCKMLADRGGVYLRSTVRFAAHTNCHCIAGPVWDPDAPKASTLQYVASSRTRTKEQREELRNYLNTYYPDAPG